MCLWWLLSHRSWLAGEMWRGRFTRIKWACLTFLICTSGSLTKTANLELKERRPSPPIIGDTNRKGCTLICEPFQARARVLLPPFRHAQCVHLHIWVCLFECSLLRSRYFSAGWFICSRLASSPSPSLCVCVYLCLSLPLHPPRRLWLTPYSCCMWFSFSPCAVSHKIYGKLDELSLPAAMSVQYKWSHVGRGAFYQEC